MINSPYNSKFTEIIGEYLPVLVIDVIELDFLDIQSEIKKEYHKNGNIITDQKKVAAKFNKFYANIAGKLLCDLGKPNTK